MRCVSVYCAVASVVLLGVLCGSATAQVAPAPSCGDKTPSALRFVGLPSRIPFGRDEVFSLDYDNDAWNVEGRIDITMRSGDNTFFHDATDDELADLYVELDLRDKPATITATFAQSQDAELSPVTCVRTITTRTRGYRHFGAINRCDPPGYRPRSIMIACGAGNFGLTRLQWRGWNRAVARARGQAYANDCVPYCAVGTFHHYPVRTRAFRPRRMGGAGYAYTRLRITFTGARPEGALRTQLRKGAMRDGSFFWR